MNKPIQDIVCPTCGEKASREGAQYECDVYVCPGKHITMIKVNAPRNEWKESKE